MSDSRPKYPEMSSRKAAEELDALIDQINREDTPVLIQSKAGHRAVLISLDEFQFLEELIGDVAEEEENDAHLGRDAAQRVPTERPQALSENYAHVYQFKITLKGIRPPIWRRIQVPENYTFWDLHVAIQDAMGWLGYHLHEFKVADPKSGLPQVIGIPDEEGFFEDSPVVAGWLTPIRQYFAEAGATAHYRYDFGDDWQHSVKLEKIPGRVKGTAYPICLAGKRACPPEDCGGIWGYYEILEMLADPESDDLRDHRRWIGEHFDPDHFDARAVYFHHPRQRWADTFGDPDTAEEDEESTAGLLKVLSRKHLHAIWGKAKSGELEDLPPEDQRTARIMLEHQSEFFNQFEFADLTYDHEYDPDSEVNPFLHIAIHTIVENQLQTRDPQEAFQFYSAMRRQKCSHHDAVHIIGTILAPLLLGILQNQRAFDTDRYIALLKKYKNRRPDKIMDLLEDEPLLNDIFP